MVAGVIFWLNRVSDLLFLLAGSHVAGQATHAGAESGSLERRFKAAVLVPQQ